MSKLCSRRSHWRCRVDRTRKTRLQIKVSSRSMQNAHFRNRRVDQRRRTSRGLQLSMLGPTRVYRPCILGANPVCITTSSKCTKTLWSIPVGGGRCCDRWHVWSPYIKGDVVAKSCFCFTSCLVASLCSHPLPLHACIPSFHFTALPPHRSSSHRVLYSPRLYLPIALPDPVAAYMPHSHCPPARDTA